MKLKIIKIICLLCFCGVLYGCTGNTAENTDYKIVCTMFPQYDWVKNITDGAENADVTLICDNGTDPHSYQATAEDILKISTCDLVICTGSTSDSWAIEAAEIHDVTAVSLTDLIGIHSHNHDEHEEHHEACEVLSDEHVWMSPKKAYELVKRLAEIIKSRCPSADIISENTEKYLSELQMLHEEYESVCKASKHKTVVVADRFPFVHLMNDYGIDYYAAFPGCSADADASFETVVSLAEKIDKYGLSYVIVTESPDLKTAEAVINNTANKNQQTVTINSLQSVTKRDIDGEISYLSVMKQNLEALCTALN